VKTYEVTVERDGRWWMVAIPELDGLTQARRLDEAEQMAREYIAVTTDVPLSRVAVEISGIAAEGQDLLQAKLLVDGLRRRAKDLDTLVGQLTREVASSLTDASVPVRDVSTVLGISHQRVSQLVQAAEGDSTKAMRKAQQEFAYDLVIKLADGRAVRIVEVTAPKSARSGKVAAQKPASHQSDHQRRNGAGTRARAAKQTAAANRSA
jgi:predicted RNase H-like HicB family nuclease/predicted XRE-type DNA-binding protein